MKIFVIIIIFLIIGGILFPLLTYFRTERKENNKVSKGKRSSNVTNTKEPEKILKRATNSKDCTYGYTQDLLDFDCIVPCNKKAALLKINSMEYLGFLEVQGVPFNLLSDEERFSLEKNYGDLLNGIDYEFQLYIQSRSLKLDNYVERYKEKIETLKKKVTSLEEKITLCIDQNEIAKLNIELKKNNNQLEYGNKLLDDFKIKNVDSELLERRYYIILKYVHDDSEFENLSDNEILEFAYNDLGNRANLFIDTLVRNNLTCTFLNGMKIAELQYNASNKEDASSLKIENAIKAKYNHFCTTSDPIFLKEIDSEINNIKEQQHDIEKKIKENYNTLNLTKGVQ